MLLQTLSYSFSWCFVSKMEISYMDSEYWTTLRTFWAHCFGFESKSNKNNKHKELSTATVRKTRNKSCIFFSGKLIIKNIQGIIFRSSSPYIHSLQFHVIMHIADTLVLLTSSPKQEVTRGCHLKEKTTLFMSRCGWKAAMHRPVRRRDNSQVWETS